MLWLIEPVCFGWLSYHALNVIILFTLAFVALYIVFQNGTMLDLDLVDNFFQVNQYTLDPS